MLFAALAGAAEPAARAEGDWFSSLYTPDGNEVRADERVFTLYAAFNAAGYDTAAAIRQQPFPKLSYHPVRDSVRKVVRPLSEQAKQADAFFDAHPAPQSRYVAAALDGGKDAELRGLDLLLRGVREQAKLSELYAQSIGEYRKAMKGYLPVLDSPLTRVRKLLRVAEGAARPMVVLNLLDADDQAVGATVPDGIVVVVGPSEKPAVEAVIREYARAYLDPKVSKAASGWPGGPGLLREAQRMGATEATVPAYAGALFGRAAALKATEASEAAYEAQAQRGYFGLKEIAQLLDEGRPVEAWAADALLRAETRRPARR